jgi:hypothetical protein
MRRVLLVETASPGRVRKKAEEILDGGLYCSPDLTILCRDNPQSVLELSGVKGAHIIPLSENRKDRILDELKCRAFDVVYAFWTGEKQYRKMKLDALRIPARYRDIDIGDGHVFRLTAGSFVRFLLIRWKHPLPTDHGEFVDRRPEPAREEPKVETEAAAELRSRGLGEAPPTGPPASFHRTPAEEQSSRQEDSRKPERPHGERVLIIQSAEPRYLLHTLERLREQPLFREPRYTLFCRNKPEVIRHFKDHPMLSRVITHSELKGAFQHWSELRRERFDAVVAFFTGDPSYWKIKYLAFLLGARHKVIFNENSDCFFFSWRAWFSHLSYRLARRGSQGVEAPLAAQARALAIPTIKLVLFPFRFLWLLLVWLWLRSSGVRVSE